MDEPQNKRPHVITAYHHYTEPGPFNNGGWAVWVEVWDGEPGESEQLADELFGKKKNALEWCQKTYPGVKVLYSTEATRKKVA